MWSNDDRSTTTTRAIVTDYFNWRLKVKTATNDRLCIIVRNIGFDCETSYFSQEPFFHFRFPALSLIDVRNIHYEIAKELFNDGSITWTRIITFISFSAILAEYLIKQQQQNSDILISSLIDWTTNFIDIDLHTWLESQNYWVNYFIRIIL